jgi:hypothetical protein
MRAEGDISRSSRSTNIGGKFAKKVVSRMFGPAIKRRVMFLGSHKDENISSVRKDKEVMLGGNHPKTW